MRCTLNTKPPRLITPQAGEHAQRSPALTSISAADIIRRVAMRVFLWRGCTVTHRSSIMSGVLPLQAKRGKRGGSSHRFCGCLKSRVPSLEEMLLFLSLTHTHSSVTTEGQQCSQASQSGRVGNEAVSSSVCDRGWMDGSYVCTRCVSGEPDGCSCV